MVPSRQSIWQVICQEQLMQLHIVQQLYINRTTKQYHQARPIRILYIRRVKSALVITFASYTDTVTQVGKSLLAAAFRWNSVFTLARHKTAYSTVFLFIIKEIWKSQSICNITTKDNSSKQSAKTSIQYRYDNTLSSRLTVTFTCKENGKECTRSPLETYLWSHFAMA